MKVIVFLSEALIPILIFWIVSYGLANKRPVYEDFVVGAKEGFTTVLGIMPTLVGLMVAVGILRASGFLVLLTDVLSFFVKEEIFPSELLPMSVVKLFSSSAATGLLLDIYKEFGADSYLGRLASVMMSSTETVFYTLSVYFMSIKVTKSRYAVVGALVATVAGIVASVWVVG